MAFLKGICGVTPGILFSIWRVSQAYPWCIWGDFNDMLYEADTKGNSLHPRSLLEGFRNTIESWQLSELDLSGGRYTWEKSRGTKDWVRERLDRAFATAGWWTKFHLYNLSLHHAAVSDHEPLCLELVNTKISLRTLDSGLRTFG